MNAAFICSILGAGAASLMMRYGLGWFTSDPLVKMQALTAQPHLVAFVGLYILFLTLEGHAISLNKLRMCILISVSLALVGGFSMQTLHARGLLTLASLWKSQAGVLAVATAGIGLSVAAGLRGTADSKDN